MEPRSPSPSPQEQHETMATATESTAATATSPEKSVPARNLSEAFDALCVDDDDDDDDDEATSDALVDDDELPSRSNKALAAPLISPTSVAVVDLSSSPQSSPSLTLHPLLRRELSQALVDRISFYGIIHDVNKEAVSFASHDSLDDDVVSPLVQTTLGNNVRQTTTTTPSSTSSTGAVAATSSSSESHALIDEEEWLLTTIAARSRGGGGNSGSDTIHRPCPPTFLQAMGEKEYENPVASLAGNTRTQLWKPSRSWWEAKSGKNPWIEPSSHNKRWRYLWPLIHYHKFLAKCVKKLKRNGIDFKASISPVAVFLREEVCAVSDHLAALSLFDSGEWMECLPHFRGWTDPDLEHMYRDAILQCKLRPIHEQGDVDSPLLRSQIDEQFLRSMATARAQLQEAATLDRKTASKNRQDGQPPPYPRGSPVPKQIGTDTRSSSSRPRWKPGQQQPQQPGWWPNQHHHQHPYGPTPPPPQQWDMQQQQQNPAAPPYCDNSSVHSALSMDSSYPTPMPYPPLQPPHPSHMQQYYHYPPSSSETSHASGYVYNEGFDPRWADPAMMYAMHMQQYYAAMTPQVETSPEASESPPKANDLSPSSPFWSHLDRATLAMGLATPAKSSPLTPRRRGSDKDEDMTFAANAQPLLLQQHQYYGYGNAGQYGTGDGYPSPATQFMMSPQANFAYNYSYDSPSPKRNNDKTPRANRKTPRSAEKLPLLNGNHHQMSPPPLEVSKRSSPTVVERGSPSTVETTAETESLHEAT